MITLKTDLDIDNQLCEIWRSYYGNEECISPIYQKEIEEERITFLSLNPSLPPKFRKDATKGFLPDCPYRRIDSENRRDVYSFFHKFYDQKLPSQDWSFLDLLYIRDSSQKNLEELFYSAKAKNSIDTLDFFMDQVALTFKLLKKIMPQVVVVSNKFAWILIKHHIIQNQLHEEEPQPENGMVYRVEGIPFIVKESQFLGSRIHARNDRFKRRFSEELFRVFHNISS